MTDKKKNFFVACRVDKVFAFLYYNSVAIEAVAPRKADEPVKQYRDREAG
jgi:hypothetical protein